MLTVTAGLSAATWEVVAERGAATIYAVLFVRFLSA